MWKKPKMPLIHQINPKIPPNAKKSHKIPKNAKKCPEITNTSRINNHHRRPECSDLTLGHPIHPLQNTHQQHPNLSLKYWSILQIKHISALNYSTHKWHPNEPKLRPIRPPIALHTGSKNMVKTKIQKKGHPRVQNMKSKLKRSKNTKNRRSHPPIFGILLVLMEV